MDDKYQYMCEKKKRDNKVHGGGSLQSLFYKPEIPCCPSFADAKNQKLHEELNVMGIR